MTAFTLRCVLLGSARDNRRSAGPQSLRGGRQQNGRTV
jgi:hypothetical protein